MMSRSEVVRVQRSDKQLYSFLYVFSSKQIIILFNQSNWGGLNMKFLSVIEQSCMQCVARISKSLVVYVSTIYNKMQSQVKLSVLQ